MVGTVTDKFWRRILRNETLMKHRYRDRALKIVKDIKEYRKD